MADPNQSDRQSEGKGVDEGGWHSFTDKIEVPYDSPDPQMGQIRGLMIEMKVENMGQARYRVTDHVDTFDVNLIKDECSCSTGDGFKCRHIWHVEYRIETDTLPDR